MLTVQFHKLGKNYYFTPQTYQNLYELHYGLGLYYDNDINPLETYHGFLNQIVVGLFNQYQVVVNQVKNKTQHFIRYTTNEFTIVYYPETQQLVCILTEKQYQQHLQYLSSYNS